MKTRFAEAQLASLWGGGSATQAWAEALLPYAHSIKVFKETGWPAWMPQLPVDYYFNLLPACVPPWTVSSIPAGIYTVDSRRLAFPSAFIVLSEDLYISPHQETDPTNEKADRTGFSASSFCYPPPHQGAVNILYGDLHVGRASRFEDGAMTYWYTNMANWQTTAP